MKHSPYPHWVKRAVPVVGVMCSLAITLTVAGQPEYICYTASKVALEETIGVTFFVTDPPVVRANHLEVGEV